MATAGKIDSLDLKAVRIGLAGLIAVVFTVIFTVNLIGGNDSSDAPLSETPANAVTLSESELLARGAGLEHPAYWVGARPGINSYELETDSAGNIYVRYPTDGVGTTDPRADSLTVGTYPVAKARQALGRAAREATEGQTLAHRDGFVMLSGSRANSAYVVFDDQPELQVEIYSPKSGEAADLAGSGVLTTITDR